MALARLVENDAALPQGAAGLVVTGLTADSRDVRPGFVFAALPGSKADGASYIPQAAAKGAVAAVCAAGLDVEASIPLIPVGNPRRLFARMAARFFNCQPKLVVAVTGTNGKTSVAAFVRQIWETMGRRAASLGTIGVVAPCGQRALGHTTPDPVTLHETLARLARDGVDHLALEASSHGLAQYRLDGVRMAAGAFTNLTHDHLDYHADLKDYFNAKMRLFDDLLPRGAPAVINADSPEAADVAARAARLSIFTVGRAGTGLRLLASRRDGWGQRLDIQGSGGRRRILLPLAGDFQASNALVAAGLVIASGGEEAPALQALQCLKGARGRLELVARTEAGVPIFVDYAHTPDALETAILALRPSVTGRLSVVFGCGGDRDKAKRPVMGAIAARLADIAYVTDDNPRTEDAALIRAQIMAACAGGIEIADRAAAIGAAVAGLRQGDVLLVAGKGHEEGQTVGTSVKPFSDHEAVAAAVRGTGHVA